MREAPLCRAIARASGQSLGRPFNLTAYRRSEAIRCRDRGEPPSEIARSYDVHPSAISKAYGVISVDILRPASSGTCRARELCYS